MNICTNTRKDVDFREMIYPGNPDIFFKYCLEKDNYQNCPNPNNPLLSEEN